MLSDRLIGLLFPLAFLAALVGIPVMLWRERRRPSSYTRSPEYLTSVADPSLDGWHKLTAAEQEAVDNAALDLGEQAEIDAQEEAAAESARFLADRVRVNSLYRP